MSIDEDEDDTTALMGKQIYAPRHRRTYVSRILPIVYCYGRCGGGNYEEYENEIDAMRSDPQHLYSEEDTGDCTYMNFFLYVPVFNFDLWLVSHYVGGDITPEMIDADCLPEEHLEFFMARLTAKYSNDLSTLEHAASLAFDTDPELFDMQIQMQQQQQQLKMQINSPLEHPLFEKLRAYLVSHQSSQ
jgi:hypothetical protein